MEQGKKRKAAPVPVTCYSCGQEGHYASACPNKGESSAVAFSASSSSGRTSSSINTAAGSAEEKMAELIQQFGAKRVLELSLSLSDDQGKQGPGNGGKK